MFCPHFRNQNNFNEILIPPFIHIQLLFPFPFFEFRSSFFILRFLILFYLRFDIKGSWVGRSADPVKPTKKVVCRHCNTLFIPISKEQCTVVIGRHEANVVLKDNDLHIKISLDPTQAADVIEILKKDSNLLAKLGVIDYR